MYSYNIYEPETSVPDYVFEHCDNPHEFTLWCTIKWLSRTTGEFTISTELLSKLSKMSIDEVSSYRKNLLEKGLIDTEIKIDENNKPSLYFSIPLLTEERLKQINQNKKPTEFFVPFPIEKAKMITSLNNLTNELPSTPGIYFVCSQIKIMYIGKATNLSCRWKTGHHKQTIFDKLPDTYLLYISYPIELITKAEEYYINKYHPVFNKITLDEAEQILPEFISTTLKDKQIPE